MSVVLCVKVKGEVEQERQRLIEESQNPGSDLNVERNKTYDRLVVVQEDLLRHVRSLKVREGAERGGEREVKGVSLSLSRLMLP